MAENNPDETYTFVDKRKAAEQGEAASVEASAETPSAVEPSSFTEEEDASSDPMASYGLAAYVTGLIASDAWQKMGLIADPSTGTVNPDLEQSRFSIDCVAALVGVIDKHEAHVPGELRQDLNRVLSDLRLNFVEQTRRRQA